MKDRSDEVEKLALETQAQLADWIDRLPRADPEARRWLKVVTTGQDDVTRALGIPTHKREQTAVQTVIASDHPLFGQFRSDLNQRIQIYLGGVEGLARSESATTDLRSHADKLHEIRRMLRHDPRVVRPPDRTLGAVVTAVNNGSLRGYRTGDVDSDLWVVLKTLQEHLPSKHDSLSKLVEFVTRVVGLELAHPGQHISDRRHAWWAVRILYEASSITQGYMQPEDLEKFVLLLLAEPLYTRAASMQWLSPEFNEQLTVIWELTNISELLRGGWNLPLSDSLLRQLVDREESLMSDVLESPKPNDIRVATVSSRACLTYLADQAPTLWGKDL